MRFRSHARLIVTTALVVLGPARVGVAQDEPVPDAPPVIVPAPPDEHAPPEVPETPAPETSAPEAPLPGPADRLPPPLVYAPPPPGPTALEVAVHPLLQEAEADLAAARNAYARARTAIVSAVLPPQSPLRIRSDGLHLLARQRTSPSAAVPDLDAVLSPLFAHAQLDLRMGQHELAALRLRILLERTAVGSRLRAMALRAWRSLGRAAGPPPAPLARDEAAVDEALTTSRDPTLRGVGEVVELYVTAGLFGGLTGAFLPLVISDGTASDVTYTLTVVGGTALLVAGVLTLDLSTTIRTGVAPTISAGIRLGLAHGVIGMGLDTVLNTWDPARAISFTWGGAAVGLATGIAFGFGLTPSVEDARFVESVGLYGGVVGAAAALMARDGDPAAALALAMIGLDAGILTGILVASLDAHPSTERTLFLDLGVLAGAGFGALIPGLYYVYGDADLATWPFGLGMAIGAVGGFLISYLVTDAVGMARPRDEPADEAPEVSVGIAPSTGGALLDLTFSL